MHWVGEITVGNVLTIFTLIGGAAYAGGKLTQVLKALAEKVAVMETEFEQHRRDFRQHEKEDYEAFGKIHEQLIELAMNRPR